MHVMLRAIIPPTETAWTQMPSVRIFIDLRIAPTKQGRWSCPIAGIVPATGHWQADSEGLVEHQSVSTQAITDFRYLALHLRFTGSDTGKTKC
jgi:hypothetical protein